MRSSEMERKTKETSVKININVDGSGEYDICTGVGFFNHMLELFSKHGLFDIRVQSEGDLEVDSHHLIEDVGIVLGQAFKEAIGFKEGIKRYGASFCPMDEALAMVCVDVSGRPYLVFEADFTVEKIGDMSTEMIEEFFRAFVNNAGITVHVKILSGKNNHHMAEAIFKAFGMALKEALEIDERIKGVNSTKGVL